MLLSWLIFLILPLKNMESSTVKSNGKLPRLIFKMELPTTPTRALRIGKLFLFSSPSLLIQYVATSGIPPHQYDGSTNLKGRGPIPGCHFAQIPFYEVLTNGLFMPKVKGVEGTFYQIIPSLVSLKGTNIQRGDFGIHFDANVPGSAGCVVLRKQTEWDSFRERMLEFAKEGIVKIPLTVEYS